MALQNDIYLNTFVLPEKPRVQQVMFYYNYLKCVCITSLFDWVWLRLAGRQLVNHRHILVNGHIVDIPTFSCKPCDLITAKDEQKSRTLIQNSLNSSPHEEVPNFLTLQPFQYKGLVNQIIDSKWVGLKINELLVVEYYSRQT